jgi:hypothetical protein
MRVGSFVFVGSLTLLTVALCGAAAVLASPAVQQGRAVQPGPMPADHPVARRAAAVVEQIVAGNRDAAIAAMKKEGTAELAASHSLEPQVDGYIQLLAKKGYKISEFNAGQSGNVIVRLAGESGDVTVEILFSAEAPHRLQGLGRLMRVR